ncbi:hypothetical protein [Isoptericola aurantiacus]|uniref:hypothetical protein n=1 Tax=Isoptericola aurantiacus TaxID=3377839 RepID=UPI00383A22E5
MDPVTSSARVVAGAAAGGAVWLGYLALGALLYAGLLVLALVTGADAGGPLAGPLLVVIGAVTGLVAVLWTGLATLVGALLGRGRIVRTLVVSAAAAGTGPLALVVLDVRRDLVPGVSPGVVALVAAATLVPAWCALALADSSVTAGSRWWRSRSTEWRSRSAEVKP